MSPNSSRPHFKLTRATLLLGLLVPKSMEGHAGVVKERVRNELTFRQN
jgi:hypothetical protein